MGRVLKIRVKYKIKFSKSGNMIYIGHLDLLKVTQRAVKRSGLPIAYSQGFNPHQQMSFALPLSLGVVSYSEVLDIELTEEVNPNEIKDKLNKSYPDGIEILSVRKFNFEEKNSASQVEVGTYEVFCEGIKDLKRSIEVLMKQDEIVVSKKTKRKDFKDTDVKHMIYELKALDENKVFLKISTGSKLNLKPELIIEHLYKLSNIKYNKLNINIVRTGMYKLIDGKCVDLI